jgi:GNAT superfamily N-acetyltransferase
VIRPFRRQDARAAAEVQVRAWRWAFVDVVDEDRMPTVERREAQWAEDHDIEAWVWDQDGLVAGVVGIAGPELQVLYVDPAAQGAGVGSALLEHAVQALRAAGHAEAVLWVLEENGHARGFYEQRGWLPDGVRASPWPGATSIRYRRGL